MQAALAVEGDGPITAAVVLPAHGPERFQGSLTAAEDDDIEAFIEEELGGAIAIACMLSRYWQERTDLPHEPRYVFITNAHDGAAQGAASVATSGKNAWAYLLRSAMKALIRVWRDESEVDVHLGRRRLPEWGNQIIRYDNTEPENLPFTAGHAARLLFNDSRIRQINLFCR